MSNRKRDGRQFSDAEIQAVWEKGTVITYSEKDTKRKDTCGATIIRKEYGNTNSSYGWEIDHMRPLASNGSDDLSNLQPLQWENNRYKGDNYPNWSCKVRS
jgi:hypothetical protein